MMLFLDKEERMLYFRFNRNRERWSSCRICNEKQKKLGRSRTNSLAPSKPSRYGGPLSKEFAGFSKKKKLVLEEERLAVHLREHRDSFGVDACEVVLHRHDVPRLGSSMSMEEEAGLWANMQHRQVALLWRRRREERERERVGGDGGEGDNAALSQYVYFLQHWWCGCWEPL